MKCSFKKKITEKSDVGGLPRGCLITESFCPGKYFSTLLAEANSSCFVWRFSSVSSSFSFSFLDCTVVFILLLLSDGNDVYKTVLNIIIKLNMRKYHYNLLYVTIVSDIPN